ncbi:MAG: DUF1549 domain-containing protein, partial [Planctomycetota bacterium]
MTSWERFRSQILVLLAAFACTICIGGGLVSAQEYSDSQPSEILSPQQVADNVDRLLLASLSNQQRQQLPPAAPASVWLRRVSYDLVGQAPSPQAARQFAASSDRGASAGDEQRSRVITKLAADSRLVDNWSSFFRDVITYHASNTQAPGLGGVLLQGHVRDAIRENRGWDDIARDLITASGKIKENPAAGLAFLQSGKPENMAAEVSRLFLGVKIECAQCHDHPFNDYRREQFHQLAAYFPRVALRPIPNERDFLISVNDRRFTPRSRNNNRFVGSPEHYMSDLEDPEAKGTLMQPAFFVTGDETSFGTLDSDRRNDLADAICGSDNPYFSASMVNRIWTELLGVGFYETPDGLGLDQHPRAAAALHYLADEFVQHDYDLRWLVETVVRTNAYSRRTVSQTDSATAHPALPRVRRLRSDQLFASLTGLLDRQMLQRLASSVRRRAGGQGMQMGGASGTQYQDIVKVRFSDTFGYDPCLPQLEIQTTLGQQLAMLNGQQTNQSTTMRFGFVQQLQRSAQNSDQ